MLEKISVERTFIEFDKLLTAPYWRKGLKGLLPVGAYDYLPDLKVQRSKLAAAVDGFARVFHFSTSEQAWAAVLL